MNAKPQPPAGYATWLDYAVETFDTREPALEAMFSMEDPKPDRDAMREAARQELRELRLGISGNADPK